MNVTNMCSFSHFQEFTGLGINGLKWKCLLLILPLIWASIWISEALTWGAKFESMRKLNNQDKLYFNGIFLKIKTNTKIMMEIYKNCK